MLNQNEKSLDRSFGKLRDIDVLPSGEWTGVFRRDDNHIIVLGKKEISVPCALSYPVIRFVDRKRIVLVDTRVEKVRENAWLFDCDGKLLVAFCAGDGIQDVLANHNSIIFTYFDEGVFGDVPPSQEGHCVFSANGKLNFGYQSAFAQDAVDIADCYCACWGNAPELWFSAYTGFPLVMLNIETREQQVFELPEKLHGANAISTDGSGFFFYSSYEERNAILSWKPGTKPKFIGFHSGPFRGLSDGRFLSGGDFGFTIVDPKQPA